MCETNQAAFLLAIRLGEGTGGADGYSMLCGGVLWPDDTTHPSLDGWTGFPLTDEECKNAGCLSGCVSTAAGAYQIIKPTWQILAAKLSLPDFSAASQDAAALKLIDENGATADVLAGHTETAIAKISKVWASLPGSGYGQREVTLGEFNSAYTNAGGVIA